MIRPYTIIFLSMLSSILWAVPTSAQSGEQVPPPAIDAERRIVKNLAEGLPRYDGVTIRYAFKMISEVGWTSAEDLVNSVTTHFEHVLSSELISENGNALLCITTDGSHSNHEAYNHVLDLYGSSLARHPRSYDLK